MTHGATIGPDVGAVVFGLMASFAYWKYIQTPSMTSAVLAGLSLGFAVLCKLTWLTGLVSLPLVVMSYFYFGKKLDQRPSSTALGRDMLLSGFVVVLVVNAGYGFERTMMSLGDYQFCSEMLGGKGASRFTPRSMRGPLSNWSSLPIPLPRNFVLGIDFLRAEVEERKWSFVMENWRLGSWLHYYVMTTHFKTPEPTLIAALVGICVLLKGIWRGIVDSKVIAMFLTLGIPATAAFVSVSLQGGFNHHHRYVLPICPFLFFLAAFIAYPTAREVLPLRMPCICPKRFGIAVPLGTILCILMIASTLRVHPYYTSYFNTLSGGPENGWRLLGFSNIDWGQDILEVDKWLQAHPDRRPLVMDLDYFAINGKLFDVAIRSFSGWRTRHASPVNCCAAGRTPAA